MQNIRINCLFIGQYIGIQATKPSSLLSKIPELIAEEPRLLSSSNSSCIYRRATAIRVETEKLVCTEPKYTERRVSLGSDNAQRIP